MSHELSSMLWRGSAVPPGGKLADYTYNILSTASSATFAALIVLFFRVSRVQDLQRNLRWRHLFTFLRHLRERHNATIEFYRAKLIFKEFKCHT